MQTFHGLWYDRRGAFAPITAIVLTVIVGFAALAIDMGHAYYMRNRLQVTADASALAGASQLQILIEDGDSQPMIDEALEYADNNMPFADYGNVLVAAEVVAGNWDPDARTFTVGAPYNAVMTTTRQEEASNNAVPAFLGGIAGFSSYDANASAIATQTEGDPLLPSGCIMATNTGVESVENAFYIFGTADITLTDCSIDVASLDPCAMYAHGDPSIVIDEDDGTIPDINVSGGYCYKGGVAGIDPESINEGVAPSPDPYEETDPCEGWDLCEQAKAGHCDYVGQTFNGSAAPPPGVYCGGIKWTGEGTATFEGDYIIKDGALDIGANIAVDGSAGVGFYLMGQGSVVDFGGTANMTLTAHLEGDPPNSNGIGDSPNMHGFIFFEEDKDPKEDHTLRGTNDGGYDGVLYFDGNVELKGTAGAGTATSDCTVLIANTVYFNGTTALDADASCGGGGSDLPPGSPALTYRLVN